MKDTINQLKKRYPKHLHKLFNYGSTGLLDSNGIVAYEHIGVSPKDINQLYKMAIDEDFNSLEYDDCIDTEEEESKELRATFVPCHALIALAGFEAHEFSKPLMMFVDNIDEDDDYYRDALAYFFAMNWTHNIELFDNILFDTKVSLSKKEHIFEIFSQIIEYHMEFDDLQPIEELTIKFLNSKETNAELNALAINILITTNGVKHIEFIRDCFQSKSIDNIDLEEIEIYLGLKEDSIVSNILKPKTESLFQRLFTFWKS